MENLLNNIDIFKKIKNSKNNILFFDYDGTLTEFVKDSQKALLPKDTSTLLREISECKKYLVFIVSGRSIKQLNKFIKIKNIGLIGNHGFEIDTYGLKNKKFHISPSEFSKYVFGKKDRQFYSDMFHLLKIELRQNISDIPGAYIEDKDLTLTLHWRAVKNDFQDQLKNIIKNLINDYSSSLEFIEGKKVLNVLPGINWNKGKAIKLVFKMIPELKKYFSIYIGDDKTDELGFNELKGKTITVCVGKKKNSNADFYLKNVNEVILFLKKIKEL